MTETTKTAGECMKGTIRVPATWTLPNGIERVGQATFILDPDDRLVELKEFEWKEQPNE